MTQKKLCTEHQRQSQGSCATCKKDLCDLCGIRLSGGQVFCAACFPSRNPEADAAALATFRQTWTQFQLAKLLGILLIAAFVFFMNRGYFPSCSFRIGTILYFFLPGYFIVYLCFLQKLRCPSCGCHVLFYLGNTVWEMVRSRFCPRCGLKLKD